MYKLSYCEEKNRIYIDVEGTLQDSELDEYKNELLGLIEITSPGFTVLGDVSKSHISVLNNSGKLQAIRDHGTAKGILACAAIISEQAYQIHIKKPYEGVKYAFIDKAEAEQFLDSLGKE